MPKKQQNSSHIPDWCQDPVWALPSWFCDWTGHFSDLGDSSLCGFFLSSLSQSYIWKALWTSIKRGTRSLILHYLAYSLLKISRYLSYIGHIRNVQICHLNEKIFKSGSQSVTVSLFYHLLFLVSSNNILSQRQQITLYYNWILFIIAPSYMILLHVFWNKLHTHCLINWTASSQGFIPHIQSKQVQLVQVPCREKLICKLTTGLDLKDF